MAIGILLKPLLFRYAVEAIYDTCIAVAAAVADHQSPSRLLHLPGRNQAPHPQHAYHAVQSDVLVGHEPTERWRRQ
jgi:hypothetical protein